MFINDCCRSSSGDVIFMPLQSSMLSTLFSFFLLLTNKPALISGLPAFIGDLAPRQYLRQICATSGISKSTFNRDTLVIIDDFQDPIFSFSGITKRKPTFRKRRKGLSDFWCFNSNFNSNPNDPLFLTLRMLTTVRQITSTVLNSPQLKYRQLTLFFDFELLVFENSTAFGTLLQTVTEVFCKCHNCRPLVAIFSLPQAQLKSWSDLAMQNELKGLQQIFQAVLVSSSSSSTVHLNPTLFGCQLTPGVFVPSSQADFGHLSTNYRYCNLQAATLNASYNQKLPFCDITQKEGGQGQLEVKFAVETEIVKILQANYNFSLRLFNARGAWGMLVRGRWTGTVGMVLNGTTHFGMCYISRTPARMAVVDYSYPIYVDELTFLSRSPKLRARHWLVLSPFTTEVWLCNLAVWLVLAVIVFFALKKCSVSLGDDYKFVIPRRPSAMAILLQLYAIFMGQSNKLRWGEVPTVRLLYGVWVPMVLVLANSYGGRFYSILALPEFEAPIDTLDALERIARADSGQLITFDDSSYLAMFQGAVPEDGVIYEIGRHMNRSATHHVADDEESIRAIERRPRTTLIATRLYLATIRRVYSHQPLHLGSESLNLDYTSFIFPKRSPLLPPFSAIIKRMYQSGMITKLLGSTFNRLPGRSAASLDSNPTTMATSSQSSVTPNPLALADLRSVFVLWSFGTCLALASFLLYEMLFTGLLAWQMKAAKTNVHRPHR